MTAVPRGPSEIAGDVVTFSLAGEVLAVKATRLREVLEPTAITRVPGASDFAAGLLNVRGAVVPLADLRVPLRMPSHLIGPDSRILVLDLPINGQDCVVGIIADAVHAVTRIEDAALENIPSVGTRWPPRYVAAVGRWQGEFVTLPDLNAILLDVMAGQPPRAAANTATPTHTHPHPETA
ncbi:chemotaxis protein CheW [Loktanella sp. DJP18]|uniref:chemotaxis protein CheW n=1 Tax=Loktanella sp. DJP18 TaxID=3409788 RepID=UPI003BB5035A